MNTLTLLVKQVRHEADGVISVILCDPSGADLPAWEPGAHIDVRLPDGLVRQYSLCGDPADKSAYRIGVLREIESRGGSRWIHDDLRVSSLVEVSKPRNHFHFTGGGKIRFVAGGIGITPLLPMIREAQGRGLDWHLTYGGRTRASMAFLEELSTGLAGDRVTVHAQDEAGLIDLATAVGTPDSDTVVYACGPAPLLAALEEHCSAWGQGALHLERFAVPTIPATPAESTTAVQDGQEGVPGEGPGTFEVVAERSGVEITITGDESIVDGLEAAGIFPGTSCREGICGSCEVKVLDGVPLHRDYVLTEEEKAAGATMMICVSRAKTPRLVLDI